MIEDLVAETLHSPLFDQAELVRWRMADLPFDRIEHDKVTPELCALVRQIAFSELTTFSATRRFMTDLADDVDFTQWIAVWFYEETKHPQALLRWLHRVGVAVDAKFILKGRATAPFMRSRMGTLVTNIISELVASSAYMLLVAKSPEPVLAQIAERIAGDEARHAASFFMYAQRLLERSQDADSDRRDALKVLYMWFQGNELVSHPVNEFFTRIDVSFDVVASRDRISRLIGILVGREITGSTDLLGEIRALGGK